MQLASVPKLLTCSARAHLPHVAQNLSGISGTVAIVFCKQRNCFRGVEHACRR